MAGRVKVAGTWRNSTAPYVKVGGNWKIAKSAWAKVDSKWKSWFLQGGVTDFTFFEDSSNFTSNIGTGASSTVNAIEFQSDGKIVIGGAFSSFNGTTVGRIVRLNSDGTLDTAFTTSTGTGAELTINSMAIQSDDKILIGGTFTTFNGATATRIARLNSNGTLDTAFTTNTGTGASNTVNSIAIQSDGKIVIGGGFTTFNGATATRIARLNSDGTLDTAFMSNIGTGANSTINAMAIQSDDKIVIGGSFLTFNGATVNRIARLNSNGTLDTAFTTNTGTGASNTVNSIAIQSDGKIVIGGTFTTFNGTTVGRIVRLNSNGTLDTAFTTNTGTGVSGAGNSVTAVAIQSDGKIVIGGAFTSFNGATVGCIARLNSDGTLDTAFATNTGAGAVNTINSIAIQPDGKIVIGGVFTTFNGATVNRIARLNSDGTIPRFLFNTTVNSIAIQSDGKIVIGGNFTLFNMTTTNRIARLNSDGTLDTAFSINVGTGTEQPVTEIAIQSDGGIVIGGGFTLFNGVTVNRIARLNSDGTLDAAFMSNIGTGANNTVTAVAIQSDGKIVIGGVAAFSTFNGVAANRILRLNSDGTRDTAFTSNIGTGANTRINAIEFQSDGKILIGGTFTTFNGATANRIARLGGEVAE
jgi:uncharacterized delta-60 repeat protein